MSFKPVVWEYQSSYADSKVPSGRSLIFRQAHRAEYRFMELGLVGVYDECSFPENCTPLENHYV